MKCGDILCSFGTDTTSYTHTFHRCFMDLPIEHILLIHGGYFFFSYSFIPADFGDFARLFAKAIPIEIISQY